MENVKSIVSHLIKKIPARPGGGMVQTIAVKVGLQIRFIWSSTLQISNSWIAIKPNRKIKPNQIRSLQIDIIIDLSILIGLSVKKRLPKRHKMEGIKGSIRKSQLKKGGIEYLFKGSRCMTDFPLFNLNKA